jgi:hypothetical protein
MVFIFGYLDSLANTYLTLYSYANLFRYGYTLMLAIMYPVLIVSVVFMGIIFISSQKVKKALERGIPVR